VRCLNPFPGGYSAVAPPDPIPNSEVKRSCADGSVDFHARVGHRQGLYPEKPSPLSVGVFAFSASAHPQQVTARGFILKAVTVIDGTACHHHAFAMQLPPNLVGPVHRKVGSPDPLDMPDQLFIALGAQAAP
jgi:hypothetical protein